MESKRHELTRDLILIAMFTAIIFVLGMTPLGLIPLGFINLTILHIPVIISAMTTKRRVSVTAGFMFGLVSTINAFIKPSTLVANILAVSPVAVIVMSIVPRVLIPIVTYAVYAGMNKLLKADAHNARRSISITVAAILGSLTNTVGYLGLMGLCYVLFCPELVNTYTGMLMGVVMGIAVPCEALAAALISNGVVYALLAALKGRVHSHDTADKPAETDNKAD